MFSQLAVDRNSKGKKEKKKNSNSKLIRFLTAFWGLSPRESRAGPAPEHQSEERGEPSQLEPVR